MPYLLFTSILGAVLVFSVYLVKELREREQSRVQIFIEAMKAQQKGSNLTPEVQQLLFAIFTENNKMPMIITTEDMQPILDEGYHRNVSESILQSPEKMQRLVGKMDSRHEPIKLKISDIETQYVHYDNSQLLNILEIFPYLLGMFIFMYIGFSLWILSMVKKKNESYLWAGFAKETAHQIGTPLSSLIGWAEVLSETHPEITEIDEMKEDINRLTTISERFSKIGSVPELNDENLSDTLRENYQYLVSRTSNKIKFTLDMPKQPVMVRHNKILIGWIMENLVRNAADAMKGSGVLTVRLNALSGGGAVIEVQDNGCGMTPAQVRRVFQAGFSTKKRGWGLGLSLVKRAVENIHKGEVRIVHTAPGKGTTFRIFLKA